MQTFINPSREKWAAIITRPQLAHDDLKNKVSSILKDIKLNGDDAVKKYCLQFDGVVLDNFKVSDIELSEAKDLVDESLKAAIQRAKENITKFHAAQKENIQKIETAPGVFCWRKSVGIETVGLYIPGGSAPLFSTLLMLGIPAVLAGCNEIIVCTPPGKDGKINPVILYVSQLLGLRNIFKIGGVQAIGAMAYGTKNIPAVYKIFGPGNQYVTCAKQCVNEEGVAIDMPAGPSEVAVYADKNCVPAFVASDLLSQAEHGADSQVLLVADSLSIVEKVKEEIELQLTLLPRKAIIEECLKNSRLVVLENVNDAFDLLNEYAPEHLVIASENSDTLAEKVINAGSVFLGNYSPESAGDYASGTNHTLPTNGFARAYSGVSLDSFVKKVTFQKLNKEGLQYIGNTVELMAAAEGLDAHKNAITLRLKNLK